MNIRGDRAMNSNDRNSTVYTRTFRYNPVAKKYQFTSMKFSVVIPARNEERTLPAALDSIAAAAARAAVEVETIVVINRCEDRTAEVAAAHGCVVVNEEAKNLSRIRNAGAAAAAGEILVTMDADSRMSRNMFAEIGRVMESGRYIGGGVLIRPERYSLGIILTYACLAPIALRERILGGLFFCRRETFEEIGGFNEQWVSVEDIEFAKRLRQFGTERELKFKMLFRANIVTSCRKFDHFGDWYFLKNPREVKRVFLGRDQNLADKIWYEFPR